MDRGLYPATPGRPACLVCGATLAAEQTLHLGSLSACNRFEKRGSASAERHPLAISGCGSCDLVQLSTFPPVEFVKPRVPWIRYNEPGDHLDSVAGQLRQCLPPGAFSVLGVGPFDPPLLDRLAAMGAACRGLDMTAQLPREPGRYPYLESIQELLRPEILASLADAQGLADIVCCRYLLEHSHDPMASLLGLRHLVTAGGFLVLEVPDSTRFLAARDYSFIWEEHLCYFTEATLRNCVDRAGYELVDLWRYAGRLEDALVVVLRWRGQALHAATCASAERAPAARIFECFRSGLETARRQYAQALEAAVAAGHTVAIFGAGHQSIMFINALGLQRHISVAIDDDPNKRNCMIPGTSIVIVDSGEMLSDRSIGVCLLGVGPLLEAKIRQKFSAYLGRGGMMYSIFHAAGTGTLIDNHH